MLDSDSFFPALLSHFLSSGSLIIDLFSFNEINEREQMQKEDYPSTLFTTESSEYSFRAGAYLWLTMPVVYTCLEASR